MDRILRPFAVAFVLVVAGAMAVGQGADAQTDNASLHGTVCTAADDGRGQECHDGLPDAHVRLQKDGLVGPVGAVDRETTTDARGLFSFGGLEDGEYSIEVTRTGFEASTGTVQVQGTSRHTVALQGQQVTAQGRTVDPDGRGVPDASIQFSGAADGWRLNTANSDAQGLFTLRLVAGHYDAYVEAPRHFGNWERVLVDGEATIDLVLEPMPPQDARIQGTVRDQDGQPVADARVEVSQHPHHGAPTPHYDDAESGMADRVDAAYPYYGGQWNHTMTDAQGRYSMHIHSGALSLHIYKEGHASVRDWTEARSGETLTKDVTLHKYPEKTARIEGQVTDARTGEGLGHVYISVRSPVYGIWECSSRTGSGSGSSGASGRDAAAPQPEPDQEPMLVPDVPYRDPGCAITVHPDGRFEGTVTPGYTILRVSFDNWGACPETQDSDGSFRRDCGPGYHSHVQTLDLAADATTRIDVGLVPRPSADATVSGYVVDEETGNAVPGARVSFSNQDTWGHGSAVTDRHGSYAIRLHGGIHHVSVWTDGYLTWEGMVEVPRGGDVPFDIHVRPGQEDHGYCCYYPMPYLRDGDGMVSESATDGPGGMPPPTAPEDRQGSSTGGLDGSGEGALYEDLGGGLGPYDAAKRQQQVAEQQRAAERESPGAAVGLLAVGLGAVAILAARRRI